jgi:hypothetical protein
MKKKYVECRCIEGVITFSKEKLKKLKETLTEK